MVFALLRRRSEKEPADAKPKRQSFLSKGPKAGPKPVPPPKGKGPEPIKAPEPEAARPIEPPHIHAPIPPVVEDVQPVVAPLLDNVPSKPQEDEPTQSTDANDSDEAAKEDLDAKPEHLSMDKDDTKDVSDISDAEEAEKVEEAGAAQEQQSADNVEVKDEKNNQIQQPWDACCGILGTLTSRD